MPAAAPVDRPLESGVVELEGVAVSVTLVTLVAVGVETDVTVADARLNVDWESNENQLPLVLKTIIQVHELTGPPSLEAWRYVNAGELAPSGDGSVRL